LRPLGRCPRCGYVLRYDGRRYACDFCGYLYAQRTLTDRLQDLERSMKRGVQDLLDNLKKPNPQQFVTYLPVPIQRQRPCVICGAILPIGISICPTCGATQTPMPSRIPSPITTSNSESRDQKVYDYVVAHAGTISISQATQDLSLSPDALRLTLERLKSAGLLSQS
jgi:predicted DNA-binding transcriptional regulator